MARLIMNTEKAILEAEAALQKLDPVLGRLISSQTLAPRAPRGDYFASLTRSIIGQQVSVAAATAIYGRFEQATAMKPDNVIKLSDADIKTIGLSKQKTTYIRDLAQHFIDDPNVYAHLEKQDDEQIIAELTDVKGIGRWTAQMFLMFTLARPDVFAPDDIGLQHGIMKLYGWDILPPKAGLEKITAEWTPYRTVASWHLWQSLESNVT